MGPLDSLAPGLTLTYLHPVLPNLHCLRTADDLNLTYLIAGTLSVPLLIVLVRNSLLLCSRRLVSRTRTARTPAQCREPEIANASLALARTPHARTCPSTRAPCLMC